MCLLQLWDLYDNSPLKIKEMSGQKHMNIFLVQNFVDHIISEYFEHLNKPSYKLKSIVI